MKSRRNREAERQYARDAKALEPVAFRRLSPKSRRLLKIAESQARVRDDDHVGTEHIVLAFYVFGPTSTARALESLGITSALFSAQREDEPGPSPPGTIPLTPRARMIIALAGAEASRIGSELVEPGHVLLGVIRESEKWDATGMAGPHHLRAAADAARTTLPALEQSVIREMQSGHDDDA